MKYLILGVILVLAFLPAAATAGRYVVEEKFVPEGWCVMYDVDNGDMRKCTHIEDLKYRVEFSCFHKMARAMEEMEPYTQKNQVMIEDTGRGIYRWAGNARMPQAVLDNWEAVRRDCKYR